MGLLDDAIRDHLDLKRRRGADPAEVDRAEREALGPVRRGPEPPADPGPQLDQPLPYDDERAVPYEGEDHDWDEAFEEHDEDLSRHELDEPSVGDDEPRSPSARGAPSEILDFEPHSARAPEPPSHSAEPDDEPHHLRRENTSDDTAEYQIEPGRDSKRKDDDVLEETPEFLQDTPDHDRLWFEQRPPRDFDFDG
ncbi:MAG: hypothetical protein JO153_16325, partial [Solirubrobacterales bacterium]|nr:hypothetical protein [Solirubrobacterales bacterium]MBV9918069.1 hypothetical protein [Solirubrobacterales bacterium]